MFEPELTGGRLRERVHDVQDDPLERKAKILRFRAQIEETGPILPATLRYVDDRYEDDWQTDKRAEQLFLAAKKGGRPSRGDLSVAFRGGQKAKRAPKLNCRPLWVSTLRRLVESTN